MAKTETGRGLAPFNLHSTYMCVVVFALFMNSVHYSNTMFLSYTSRHEHFLIKFITRMVMMMTIMEMIIITIMIMVMIMVLRKKFVREYVIITH